MGVDKLVRLIYNATAMDKINIPKTVLERRRLSVYVNDELLELLKRHVYRSGRETASVILEAMRLYDEQANEQGDGSST